MKSPFKFLDAYDKEDKKIFFGREKEIDALFNMVFKTPMVMVYGLSGTGKTSLVQCGLATRFDGPDWLPFLIRKNDNINTSLRTSLKGALELKDHTEDLNLLVEKIFYSYFRPVYLIFDQLEELFILGSEKEQMKFMKDIQRLQQAELSCRIIIILREEFIGQLYEFEKIIPSLFDYKLRVEPMTNKYIEEVMLQSFKAFNISLEPPKEERCLQIIQKLSTGKSNIPLPYLQVYLDMLYRVDHQRTYPDGTELELPPLEFTAEEIDKLGKIDDVLELFLSEKSNEIQANLLQNDPSLPENTVKSILDLFVTDEGTKRPVSYIQSKKEITIEKRIEDQIPYLSNDNITECLIQLQEARLLRFHGNTIELAHDTLAALIDKQRTDEQRAISEMRRSIKSSYKIHLQTQDLLTPGQLELYRPHLSQLNLDQSQVQFITDSEAYHIAEVKRKEAELENERLLRNSAEKNEIKARQRTRVASVIAALALISAMAAFYFYTDAQQQQREAQQSLIQSYESDIQIITTNINMANDTISMFMYNNAEEDLIIPVKNRIKKLTQDTLELQNKIKTLKK